MSRGSKPGERRGGRQRGTPNKKTLLKAIAVSAAAADPNLSPLDFLLCQMREPRLPLDLRVTAAQAALPFVHPKSKDRLSDRPTLAKRDRSTAVLNGAGLEIVKLIPEIDPIARKETAAPRGDHVTANDPEVLQKLSPLDFLLGVMRDADTPLHLRFKVAAMVAPYLHPKPGRGATKSDPALGRTLRDDVARLQHLEAAHPKPYRDPLPPEVKQEMDELKALIIERGQQLGCQLAHSFKLWSNNRRDPYGETANEETEEERAIARSAYRESIRAWQQRRIAELESRGSRSPLEQGELEYLRETDELNDPEHPLYRVYTPERHAKRDAVNR